MSKKPKDKDPLRPTSIRMPESLFAEVKESCDKVGMKLQFFIVQALRNEIARSKATDAVGIREKSGQ